MGVEKPFALWDPGYEPDSPSAMRVMATGKDELVYSNETAISFYVNTAVRDVIRGSSVLKDKVKVAMEWSLLPDPADAALPPASSVDADADEPRAPQSHAANPLGRSQREAVKKGPFYLVFCIEVGSSMLPVGANVSTLPAASADGDVCNGAVLGQMYLYLVMLQQIYGIENCFGLVSTYSRWRVCWLPSPSTDALAADDHTPRELRVSEPVAALGIFPASFPSLVPSSVVARGDDDDSDARSAPTPKPPLVAGETAYSDDGDQQHLHTTPTLHCSRVFDSDDADVTRLIATAFMKMLSTTRRPMRQPGLQDSVVFLASQSLAHVSPVTLTQSFRLTFGAVAHTPVKQLYLLTALGRGRDGLTWLGMTSTGRCYVAKFLHDMENTREAAVREADLWTRLYDLHAYATTLANHDVVVLPWLKPLELTEWEQHKDLVEEAIDRIAEKGYQHMDVHMRHVGLYRAGKDGRLLAAIFDLHDVKELADIPGAKETAKKEMRQQLADDLTLAFGPGSGLGGI